jgi:hypothetical protein
MMIVKEKIGMHKFLRAIAGGMFGAGLGIPLGWTLILWLDGKWELFASIRDILAVVAVASMAAGTAVLFVVRKIPLPNGLKEKS